MGETLSTKQQHPFHMYTPSATPMPNTFLRQQQGAYATAYSMRETLSTKQRHPSHMCMRLATPMPDTFLTQQQRQAARSKQHASDKVLSSEP
jgi:hypothetical protein